MDRAYHWLYYILCTLLISEYIFAGFVIKTKDFDSAFYLLNVGNVLWKMRLMEEKEQ